MKRLVSIIISVSMFLSMSAYAVEYGKELEKIPERIYEQTFSDVPTSHWAFEYISELVNDNVLSGYPDGQFRPNNNVTRAEFAKIMISASGIQVKPATATSFEDVAVTDWYCPYIESAKEFLTGFQYGGSAMYLPNKAAIREDIAVALVKLKGYDVSVADLGMIQTMFSDYDSISETAKKYVTVAVERGLVSGYDDGTFRGQKSITRAEAATLIWRANQYGSDNKILGSETSEIIPTAAPVQTQAPTPEPTVEPALEPTVEPTAEPTPEPTKLPYKATELKNKSGLAWDSFNKHYVVTETKDSIVYLNTNQEICRLNVFDNTYEVILNKEEWIEQNTYDGLDIEKQNTYNTIHQNINQAYITQLKYDSENDIVYFLIREGVHGSSVICSISVDNEVLTVYESGKYEDWGIYERIIPSWIIGFKNNCLYFDESQGDDYCLELDTNEVCKESYSTKGINSSFGNTDKMTLYNDKVFAFVHGNIGIYDNNSGDHIKTIVLDYEIENENSVSLDRGDIEYPLIIDEENIVLYNTNGKFVLISENN